MTDRELEELIKSQSDRIVIKTTAQDILRKKQEQDKKKVRPWYFKPAFLGSVSAFAVAAVIAISVGTYYGLKPSPQVPDSSVGGSLILAPEGNRRISSASYEVLAGVSFLSGKAADQPIRSKRMDQDYFSEICQAFDQNWDMIQNLESYSSEGFTYTPVASDDPNMPYCIRVESFYLYYDEPLQDEDETLVRGYTADLNKNKLQDVRIETEVENEPGESESEIEVTLFSPDGSTVTIGRASETEGNESESEFELEERDSSGRTINSIEFELETEKGRSEKTFDIKIREGQKIEWSYLIANETESGIDLGFESENDDVEISLSDPIKVTREPRSYVWGGYTYNG